MIDYRAIEAKVPSLKGFCEASLRTEGRIRYEAEEAETCQKCGKVLGVGEWPFCGGKNNHGFPERAGGAAMIDDQIAGGARYFENLGPEKVWVESKSQLRDELRARGLRENVRHVGVPGGDSSPQTSRWV